MAAPTGVLIAHLPLGGIDPKQLAFSLDGKVLAACDPTAKQCRILHLGAQGIAQQLAHEGEGVVLSSDGKFYALLKGGERIDVFGLDTAGKSSPAATLLIGGRVRSVAISSERQQLFAAVEGAPVLRAFDLASGKALETVSTTLPEVAWLGVNEQWLVCWSPQKKAEAISLAAGGARKTLETELDFPPLALTRSGVTPSLYAFRGGSIRRWTLESGLCTAQLYVKSDPADVLADARDGRFLVLRKDGDLVIVGAYNNQEMTRIRSPSGGFGAAALTGEDGLLAFSGPVGELWIVDAKRTLARPQWQAAELGGRRYFAPFTPPPPVSAAPAPTGGGAQAALAKLSELGVQVPDDSQGGLRLRMQGTRFGPEHAKLLGELPRIQSLDLSKVSESPAILRELPQLPSLEQLNLQECPVSDDDLKYLQKFTSLQYVNLFGTEVKGPGLAALREHTNLQTVSLAEFMPREIYPFLAELTQVRTIGEWPRGLTDADLALVANMSRLYNADLQSAELSPAGLRISRASRS